MNVLEMHFDASNQIPLADQTESRATAIFDKKFIHILKAEGFQDDCGASYSRNYIYKASRDPKDRHFESLNHTRCGALGFMLLAADRASASEIFELAHEQFLGRRINELHIHLTHSYDGFGLEMGLIHTDSPQTSIIKILCNEFGDAGFAGSHVATLMRKHAGLFRNARIFSEDYNFNELYSYCDGAFEQNLGAEHTLNFFETLTRSPASSSILHNRDPERFQELLCRLEESRLSRDTPKADPIRRPGL